MRWAPGATRALVPVLASAVLICAWSPRAHRSFTYDESVTVGHFVRRDDFVGALVTQRVFNNHPLLTALDWVVWHAGGSTEAWMRVPPLLAGVALVTLVGYWVASRIGLAASVAAVALVTTNPLMTRQFHEARGYALAALFATAATFEVIDWSNGRPIRAWRYGSFVALALLSHLYVAIVFIAHGAAFGARRKDLFPDWERSAWRGAAFAAPIYAAMAIDMVESFGNRPNPFRPRFPTELAEAIGGSSWTGIVLLALVVAALVQLTRQLEIAMTAVAAAIVVVIWLLVRPFDLYPRFLVWAVPLAAVAVAALVRRMPVVWLAVVVLVALWGASLPPSSSGEYDVRAVVHEYQRLARATGGGACVLGSFSEVFLAYIDRPSPSPAAKRTCDVIMFSPDAAGDLDMQARVRGALGAAQQVCIATRPDVHLDLATVKEPACRRTSD